MGAPPPRFRSQEIAKSSLILMNRSSSPKKFPLLGGAQAARPLRFPWISTSTLQLTQVLQVVLPKHLVFWPRATVRRWRVWSLPVCCRHGGEGAIFNPKNIGNSIWKASFQKLSWISEEESQTYIYIYIIYIIICIGETTNMFILWECNTYDSWGIQVLYP